MDNGSYAEGSTKSNTGGFILGLLTGIAIGGIVTLLYSPKSGTETRAQLKDELNRVQDMLQSWANDIRERADEFNQIIRFRTEVEQTTGNGQRREY